MDLRVTSVLLVLLALAEATSDRYYHVPKVNKSPYPVKGHNPVKGTNPVKGPYPVKGHGESLMSFPTRAVQTFHYISSHDDAVSGDLVSDLKCLQIRKVNLTP